MGGLMSRLVPKLRFKEFSGEWEEKKLGDVSNINMGQSPASSSYNNTNNGIYLIQGNADIKDRFSNPRQWTTEPTKLCDIGDLILTVRAPVGYIAKSLHKTCIGRGVCSLSKKENNNIEFIYQFLLSYEKNWVSLEQGSTFTAVSGNDIKSLKINTPIPKEQQKIASCLSSLDALIEAQNKKVSALKQHKKGLMQQLFPAEGEREPKLRFKAFSGEWVEKKLGDITTYHNGKAHEQDIKEIGEYIVVNSKFISTNGKVKKYTDTAFCIAQKNEILMVLSDVPNGRTIAKCFLVDKSNLYTVNQRVCKISSNNTVSVLLFYILNRNKYFLDFDDGVKQTNLKKDDVLNCPIILPKEQKEQQKIASCLSSLDALIEAQNKKVSALKQHKKALMQQMFVSNEVGV
jgi:type I restriction enzyme S subunit